MIQTALDLAKLCDTYFGFGISHTPNISKVINNDKVSGHHAIIPTINIATTDLSSLPTGERNILTLIATKLIYATAPAHKYEAVKLTGICNSTEFTVTDRTVLEMRWKTYAKQPDKNMEKSLPMVSVGQTFTVAASKGEHFTSHPTIEGLVKNGYMERNGKKIISTEKGRNLIAVVPDEIKSTKLTAEWESKLQLIEHGTYSAEKFINEIQQFIADLCEKFGWYCKGKCGMNAAKNLWRSADR